MKKFKLTNHGKKFLEANPAVSLKKKGKSYALSGLTDADAEEIGDSIYIEAVNTSKDAS